MTTQELASSASWGDKLSAYLLSNDEQSLGGIGKRKLLKPRILNQDGLGGKRSDNRVRSSSEDFRSIITKTKANNSISISSRGASESVPTFLARIQHEHRVRLQQMQAVQTLLFADVQLEHCSSEASEEKSEENFGFLDDEDQHTATAEKKYVREDEEEEGDEDGVLRASLNSSSGGGGGGGGGTNNNNFSFARAQAQRRNSLQRMLANTLSTHQKGVSFAESKLSESTSNHLDEMLFGEGGGDDTLQLYSFDCF